MALANWKIKPSRCLSKTILENTSGKGSVIKGFNILREYVCIHDKSGKKSPCVGDVGSGAFLEENGRYAINKFYYSGTTNIRVFSFKLVGIVSFGDENCVNSSLHIKYPGDYFINNKFLGFISNAFIDHLQ